MKELSFVIKYFFVFAGIAPRGYKIYMIPVYKLYKLVQTLDSLKLLAKLDSLYFPNTFRTTKGIIISYNNWEDRG